MALDKLILNAVGDVWFGDHPICIGHGINSTAKIKGVNHFFQEVKNLFPPQDINFCNLESIISDLGIKKWLLPSRESRGYPECVKALLGANFGIVNVANNHMHQHGIRPFMETLDILKKNNISFIGVDSNNKTNVEIINKNGIKMVFFGFSLHDDTYYQNTKKYSFRNNIDLLLKEIQRIREENDGILVCSLHWGQEFLHFPSSDQIRLAHKMINLGVDIILGHHPHVLQGIEKYKNGVIAYSLGNFLFDLWEDQTKRSIVLKIEITKDGVLDYRMIPIYISDDFQPRRAIGDLAMNIESNMKKYSDIVLNKNLWVDTKEYMNFRSKIQSDRRFGAYKYFLHNLYKYSLNVIFQSLVRTIFRRLVDIKMFFRST
jgi:poly-gamma-glutamate synthesis protein (capsule biosynthesis protein)